ncbi:MAG: hypothetical protein WC302_03315 [Candidatus Paceibacterota bacterium]|jgi:hypothetical protein
MNETTENLKIPDFHIIFHNGEKCFLSAATYAEGGTALLYISCTDLSSYLKLTLNCPGVPLQKGEFCVKTYSENAPFIKEILSSGIFIDTKRRFPLNFVKVHIWRFSEVVEKFFEEQRAAAGIF